MKIRLLILLLLFGFVKDCPADYITLKSGRIVEGEITYETPILVRILTSEKIRVQEFLRENIKSVHPGESPPPVNQNAYAYQEFDGSAFEDVAASTETIAVSTDQTVEMEVLEPVTQQAKPEELKLGVGFKEVTRESVVKPSSSSDSKVENVPASKPGVSNATSSAMMDQAVALIAHSKSTGEQVVSVDVDSEPQTSYAKWKRKKAEARRMAAKNIKTHIDDSILLEPEPTVSVQTSVQPIEFFRIQDLAKRVPYAVAVMGVLFVFGILFALNQRAKKQLIKIKQQIKTTAPPPSQSTAGLQSAVNELSSEFQSNQVSEEHLDFWSLIPRVILYPFQKASKTYFVLTLSILYGLNLIMYVPYLTVPFIIIFAYYTTVLMFKLIHTTGLSHKMTEFKWPNFLQVKDCVAKVLSLLLLIVVYFGPAVFCFLKFTEGTGRTFFILILPALFVLPMGLLAISIRGGLHFVNPIGLLTSMLHTFMSYVFTFLVFTIILGVNVFIGLTNLAHIPIWGKPVKWIIFAYSLFVCTRLLGVFYRKYSKSLGWFADKGQKSVAYKNDYGVV